MIDWSKGIVARCYASIIDPQTWRDITSIDIISGSINYTNSGVRGSADIECGDFDHDNEYWIRIYLNAKQGSEMERVSLFTGIASSPDTSYNGKISSSRVQCFSVLSPAEKVYLPLGWYAQAGSNGASVVKDLLSDVTPAPVVIDGSSSAISQNIVAENDETNLSMIDKILDVINWRIFLEGNGTIHIAPINDDPVASFDHVNNDILEMSVSISSNWSEIPNVFRAVGSGISSIAKDEDPNSRFSIQNRGREIWAQELNCMLNDGEKISDYASRKLKESQRVYRTLDYTRRLRPNVRVDDCVIINYPTQNISGTFIIESQTISLGYGCQVSEQAIGY